MSPTGSVSSGTTTDCREGPDGELVHRSERQAQNEAERVGGTGECQSLADGLAIALAAQRRSVFARIEIVVLEQIVALILLARFRIRSIASLGPHKTPRRNGQSIAIGDRSATATRPGDPSARSSLVVRCFISRTPLQHATGLGFRAGFASDAFDFRSSRPRLFAPAVPWKFLPVTCSIPVFDASLPIIASTCCCNVRVGCRSLARRDRTD